MLTKLFNLLEVLIISVLTLLAVANISQSIETFIYLLGVLILSPSALLSRLYLLTRGLVEKYIESFFCSNVEEVLLNQRVNKKALSQKNVVIKITSLPKVSEYSLILLFTTLGASLLISSYDLISMYLSIELQSFAVYILYFTSVS